LTRKEADFELACLKNRQRVEELSGHGRRFRHFLELEGCWYFETFHFLKGRSRVIALADYQAEKVFVLALRIDSLSASRSQAHRPRPVPP
jgi:hypothetical protein